MHIFGLHERKEGARLFVIRHQFMLQYDMLIFFILSLHDILLSVFIVCI